MSNDSHGQPDNQGLNRAPRTERARFELPGLAKGHLVDGVVVAEEAEFLRNWVVQHPDAADRCPTNRIAAMLNAIFRDGHVSAAEQSDLAELLRDLVGGKTGIIGGLDAATELPFDKPQPRLSRDGAHTTFGRKIEKAVSYREKGVPIAIVSEDHWAASLGN